jgi:signal recognition particle subunit SRP54
MPGMGGKRAKSRQQASAKRVKRGSGNPAKRAAEERAAKEKAPAAPANPFGVPAGAEEEEEFDPSSLELPADLSKFLK